MSRKRGKIVLIGTAGLNFSRDDFFKKELSFQVSSSYGPGRYTDDYEKKGNQLHDGAYSTSKIVRRLYGPPQSARDVAET